MDKKLEKQVKVQEKAIRDIAKILEMQLDEDPEASLAVAQLTVSNIYGYKAPEPEKPSLWQNFKSTTYNALYKQERYSSDKLRGWVIALLILIITLPIVYGIYSAISSFEANRYPYTTAASEDFRYKWGSSCLGNACVDTNMQSGMNKILEELQEGQTVTVPNGQGQIFTITRKNHIFEVVVTKDKK